MGFDAIIFDMDGVLVDSEPLGLEAMRRVMARHGVTYTEEDNNEFLGRTTLEECQILTARYGLEADARDLTTQCVDVLVGLIRDRCRPSWSSSAGPATAWPWRPRPRPP
jgi:phosphoglycolate phosphatase-like HAD superfamily hydrolase